MDPVCEQILQYIFDTLQGALVIPVYRSRDAALSEGQLPAVVVLPLDDIPSDDNGSICWMNWTFTVAVDIVVGEGMDSVANTYRAAAYAAIMANRDLSPTPGVIDVMPAPVSYKLDNHIADLAFVRAPFVIKYRTKHDDLTVAP